MDGVYLLLAVLAVVVTGVGLAQVARPTPTAGPAPALPEAAVDPAVDPGDGPPPVAPSSLERRDAAIAALHAARGANEPVLAERLRWWRSPRMGLSTGAHRLVLTMVPAGPWEEVVEAGLVTVELLEWDDDAGWVLHAVVGPGRRVVCHAWLVECPA